MKMFSPSQMWGFNEKFFGGRKIVCKILEFRHKIAIGSVNLFFLFLVIFFE
jgi:hypothetical protein